LDLGFFDLLFVCNCNPFWLWVRTIANPFLNEKINSMETPTFGISFFVKNEREKQGKVPLVLQDYRKLRK
jgi:hypothetical protein